MLYWQRDIEINEMESPGIDKHKHTTLILKKNFQLIFDKEAKAIPWRKESCFFVSFLFFKTDHVGHLLAK